MKNSIWFLVFVGFHTNCSSIAMPQPATSIEGVYINQSESEFSKAFDTIVVSPFEPKAATYIITHKVGFFKIAQGILQPKQYKTENSVGVFDEELLRLQEQKKGIIYLFASSGDEIIVGTSKYKKLK